jgi:hypothetical protein
MKHTNILTLLMAAIILLSGCSKDFIEQSNPNAVSVEKGFASESDITAGVYGVDQALRNNNCVGEGASLWTDDRADDINTTDNQSNNGEPFQFTAFSLVPSNTWLLNHWTALYTPISRANLILSAMPNIKFASEDTRKAYDGELRFIRAFMYYNLVKEFGDVPVVTERLTSAEQAEALTVRVKREKVYELIVADLKSALASNIAVSQTAANKGRVSMQAVNALLGKVYLTMATSFETGKAENLNAAKKYLTDCYQQRGFTKLSDIPFEDVFNVTKKSTNPEIIWQIVYKQGDAALSSALARNNQARGENINSLFVSQGNGALFTNDLLKEFEVGDLRTTFSVKFAATSNRYFITKFRDASAGAGTLGYGGNDWILMRYADVILNLAEVHMLLNETAAAISYLNMVRERAKRPTYETMQQDAAWVARYPTLKLAILHERRVELAFEHNRWHDLTRFFNATELVAYFKSKSQADYDNSPLSNITTKDYFFPIPYKEYLINPAGMYQNPGY